MPFVNLALKEPAPWNQPRQKQSNERVKLAPGAARAAVFPALVPGLATLMGWPVLGHIPTLTEAIGLTLAIIGLLVTVTRGAPADSGNSTLRSERS
jgi:hypothetical protein